MLQIRYSLHAFLTAFVYMIFLCLFTFLILLLSLVTLLSLVNKDFYTTEK